MSGHWGQAPGQPQSGRRWIPDINSPLHGSVLNVFCVCLTMSTHVYVNDSETGDVSSMWTYFSMWVYIYNVTHAVIYNHLKLIDSWHVLFDLAICGNSFWISVILVSNLTFSRSWKCSGKIPTEVVLKIFIHQVATLC